MAASRSQTDIQADDKSFAHDRARMIARNRAVAFGQLPGHVRKMRFPEEFAAIALIEAFGIENPVLLRCDAGRR
jgi:hypothetical protein